jgi:translation initiation factor 2 subunit 2
MCRLKRTQEHIQSFFLAELGTTGSIDGSERFLIRGKYPPKNIENLLRKYIAVSIITQTIIHYDRIVTRFLSCAMLRIYAHRILLQEYVTCTMCKSLDTELTKDPISRLSFLNCQSCGSQRSVAAIKAGYHATVKGERKKAREAAAS